METKPSVTPYATPEAKPLYPKKVISISSGTLAAPDHVAIFCWGVITLFCVGFSIYERSIRHQSLRDVYRNLLFGDEDPDSAKCQCSRWMDIDLKRVNSSVCLSLVLGQMSNPAISGHGISIKNGFSKFDGCLVKYAQIWKSYFERTKCPYSFQMFTK